MKKIQGIQQLQYYNEEMKVLRNLDHPYIIKYYNLFVYNNDCYLLMEFMNNSDIENFIEVNKLILIEIILPNMKLQKKKNIAKLEIVKWEITIAKLP